MSCLHDCVCSKTPQETDSCEIQVAHDESSYQPLSEASFISEAIPLLPKDPTMIRYEADPNHYALLSIIGKKENNFSKVSLARHLPTGSQVAIRRINLDFCSEDITYIQREILVVRQLKHDNLLPYFCAFVTQNEVWIIMPLIGFGSARHIMDFHFISGFSEIAIAFILKDILSALDYVHKRGFIHRSVKASHILITCSGRAILTGLKYSCNVICNGKWQNSIHSFPQDNGANLNWLSPELLEQNLTGYNAKSDIYSIGITACELANAVVPFAGLSPTQMLLEKLQGFPPKPFDSQSLVTNDNANSSKQALEHSYHSRRFTSSFHSFTETCLQRDPSKRPSATHLLSHSFIKQCKKSSLILQDMLSEITPIANLPSHFEEDDSNNQTILMQDLTLDESWLF